MNCLTDIDWQNWVPNMRATLLFVRDGDRLLLIRKKRGIGAGKINAPGGKIDPGETPIQAAVRETEEELHVHAFDPVDHGELFFQFTDGLALHVVVFVAHQHSGVATETPEAIPLWTPVDAVPYEEMWADDRVWLPAVLAGRRIRLRAIFDGDQMLDHGLEILG